MSYAWIALAATAAAGMGIAVKATISKPMPSHVVPMSVKGWASEKPQNVVLVDKALAFAATARDSGAFVGAATWAAIAASANVPSSIPASSFPSGWTASYSGATLVVCIPGAPSTAVDAINSKMSGVTAKNSGC